MANPVGRPRHEFNLETVEALARIGSTLSEIADGCGVHVETVKRRMVDDPEFSAAYKRGMSQAKESLRRLLWHHATKSYQCAIYLSKQPKLLAMRDDGRGDTEEQPTVENSDDNGGA